MKAKSFFEIRHGMSGIITGKNGDNSFSTAKEAIKEATEFKTNPRSHNPIMNDDNVEYWKTQTFTVVKKTIMILKTI